MDGPNYPPIPYSREDVDKMTDPQERERATEEIKSMCKRRTVARKS